MTDKPQKDLIQMISQPLLTEDGFVNQSCLNELASAIKNMPETWERLASNPEWSTPRPISWRQIVGALAMWSVRNIPIEDHDGAPEFPPGLENVLGYLGACLRRMFDPHGYHDLSLCQVNLLLHKLLMDDATFRGWNTEEVMESHWLDLSALLHQVCVSIRDEWRAFDRFNREFDEEWAKIKGARQGDKQ